MSTPNDMPDHARPLSKTEERRVRGRTVKRIMMLSRQLRDLTADELLALNEALDSFYAERDEMRDNND